MFLFDKRTHASMTQSLTACKLAEPPKWLPDAVVYENLMGSVAYGVSNDRSDCDIYGICVPPKDLVFPHLAGLALRNRASTCSNSIISMTRPHSAGRGEYDLTVLLLLSALTNLTPDYRT